VTDALDDSCTAACRSRRSMRRSAAARTESRRHGVAAALSSSATAN
jgi:hypothetical protein